VTLLGTSLRQHIGGRWSVSLLLFLIYLPLGIVATLGNVSTMRTDGSVGLLLVASALSLVPVAAILWISSATWLRDRRDRPAPIIAIVCLGAMLGLARSLTMYVLSVGFGLQAPDVALAWSRTLTGVLQGAALYPLAVLAFSLIATYRAERQRLIVEQIAWETRRLQDAREWEEIRDGVIAPISGELQALGADLDDQVIGVDEAARAVRQRAHALWGEAQPTPILPRVRLGTAIKASLQARPFATWLVLALWLPSALGTAIAVGELPRAVIGTCASALIILIVFEGANAVVRRWPPTWWLALPVGILMTTLLTSPSISVIGGMPEAGQAAYSAVNALWITLLVILTAIVMGAVRQGEEILQRMHVVADMTAIDTIAQEEQRRRIFREVAATLHGSLQGRLATLPDAVTAGDAVRETLALLQSRPAFVSEASLRRVAEVALEPWRTLLDIHIDISTEGCAAMVPATVAQAVSDSLEECAANSFRHGAAHQLHCRIHASAHAIEIEATDDGRGGSLDSEVRGLGSRILDRSGAWARHYSPTGTTVSITIPSQLRVDG
jgi:hypothetical protein